ncbi:MAG TPA: NAD-dependent epimerase/dehydratase family protein [Burkholderiales bacterium]|jgi:nucleoside-diphosphate-sugar epimerase|nr:NAD-dependent epimerase/dehydratase family protein [Burkholderiales bacterium]
MKIFMTGTSGYIGGTVADSLVKSGHTIIGLARTEAAAARLRSFGIQAVRGELGSHGVVRDAARAADAVINCANAEDPFVIAAIIEGLAGSGKAFLHTSGTSVVGDKAAGKSSSKVYHEDTPLDPLPEKIQRVAVHRSVLAAAALEIRSVVLCPCLIYGQGRGANPDSIQVPTLIRQAIKSGVPRYIGAGENIWSTVHIDDVADAYLLALEAARAGSFFFIENGEASLKSIVESIGRLLGGKRAPEGWSIDEAIAEWGPMAAWFSLGGNSRVNADKARSMLGWKPRGADLFHEIERGWYRRQLEAGAYGSRA